MPTDQLTLLILQVLWGLALLLIFCVGAALITSLGRRVRPKPPDPTPTDASDLWLQHRLPDDPPAGGKP